MSVHRFSFGGGLTATVLQSAIAQTSTPTITGIGAPLLIDINLTDDAALPDLQEYLSGFGWTFVTSSPTTPLPTQNHTTIQSGRNGNTLGGSFYRAINGMTLDALNRGIPVPAGTLTRVSWSKTNLGNSVLEVLNNGSVIATLANPGAGAAVSAPNVAVAAGLLSFRNQLGSPATQNVQITVVVN